MVTTLDHDWRKPFEQSPYSLRFELGGVAFSCAGAPVPRFIQALSRATAIKDVAFSGDIAVTALVACEPERWGSFRADEFDGFEGLARMGFRAKLLHEWTAPLFPHSGVEESGFHWRSFDLTSDKAGQDTLLWCSVAYDMQVAPKAAISSFFVNSERGIMLHVYDDRGMDVIALAAETLRDLYKEFDHWLLDYDRERMKAAFAKV